MTTDTDDPDGRPDDPANDCGPAVASAVEVFLGGEYVPPDTIRDWLEGEGGHGYVTFAQLGTWLRSRGLRTDYRWGSDLLDAFRESYPTGDAVMALFRWRLDQPASGHFMAVTGLTGSAKGDERGLILHDPWTGTRREMAADEWPAWYKGELMIVQGG